MSKRSKRMPALAAALLLTIAASQAEPTLGPSGSEAAVGAGDPYEASRSLTRLSVNSDAGGRTEITLATDGTVEYESFVLDGPDRLVVDLLGVVNRVEHYKLPVDDAGVVRVRAAQHRVKPHPVTRVVFDLETPLPHAIERGGTGLVVSFGGAGKAAQAKPVLTDVASIVAEMEARHPEAESEPPPVVEPLPSLPPALPEAEPVSAEPSSGRAVEPDVIERLLRGPALAAPGGRQHQAGGETGGFQTQTISTDQIIYSGQEISLNLVDADVKQVFRLFHEISGINFVLDPSVSGRVTIVLDSVPWDQALDIILKNNGLDKVLENNVIRIASTQKLAQEAAARKQLKEAEELEVEPITITRTLSYAKAREVERVIRESGVLSPRGRAIVDERTNTLIVSDIPKKVDPLDILISTLDAETPQVMIEARVVETSRDFVQDLGVVWGLTAIADASKGTSTGLEFPHNASVRYGLNLPGEGGASNLAFKFGNVIDSFTLDVALNTLETEGVARVLSSPKVATQNNERAEIEQGVRIPIVNTTATEINVEFVSASLKMSVTPQITAEGTIILEVLVENNSPDFVNTAGGIPSIRTQRAQTKVLISDGGTTVIGGIFTVNEGRSEVGVPWFRKLPGFGWLFKAQNITNQNRELLIFITPKIMQLT